MRHRGRVTSWKEVRGFGFITPSDDEGQVFVHVSSLVNRARIPTVNEFVTYTLKMDSQGRPQARDVSFVSDRYTVSPPFLIAANFLLLVVGLVVFERLPFAVLSLYSVASLITFLAYASDKAAAQKNLWRTSESKLHLLSLSGGWPGALIAQHVYRHKTRKRSFIVSFWGTVVLNCGALMWVVSPLGQQYLTSLLN